MNISAHDMHELLHREKRRARDRAPETDTRKEVDQNMDKNVKDPARDARVGDTSPKTTPAKVGNNTASDPHRGGPVPAK
jgi:hypothetical protein